MMSDAETRYKVRVAEALEALLALGAPVILYRSAEDAYSGSAGAGSALRHGTAVDLHALLSDLGPEPERKHCLRCGDRGSKRLSSFRRSSRTLDGRQPLCAACEVERVRSQQRREAQLREAHVRTATGAGPCSPAGP